MPKVVSAYECSVPNCGFLTVDEKEILEHEKIPVYSLPTGLILAKREHKTHLLDYFTLIDSQMNMFHTTSHRIASPFTGLKTKPLTRYDSYRDIISQMQNRDGYKLLDEESFEKMIRNNRFILLKQRTGISRFIRTTVELEEILRIK